MSRLRKILLAAILAVVLVLIFARDVSEPPAGEEAFLALADEKGDLLPLFLRRGSPNPTCVAPVAADGSFRFEAPSGELRLRLGSEAELREGRFRHEQAVAVSADAQTFVRVAR